MLFSLLNYYLSPRRLCLTHGSVSPHLAPRCYRCSSLHINPCGCPNKLPQTERLKTTEMDPLTVLEAGSRERGQGHPPSEASRGESFLVFSSFGGRQGTPGSQQPNSSSASVFTRPSFLPSFWVSPLFVSYKDTCRWI